MQFRQAVFSIDDKSYSLFPDKANSFAEVFADFQKVEVAGGERYSVFLHPKQDIVIRRLELQFDLQLPAGGRFFANGYQSRSESRLMDPQEGLPTLRNLARPYLGLTGDEHIGGIPRGPGYLHAWTYTYWSDGDGQAMSLAGSVDERTGFTLLLYDHPNGILTIRKDLDNLQLAHSFPALDCWIGSGTELDVFDRYFEVMGLQSPKAPLARGWSSGTNSSEALVLNQLDSVSAMFQTDTVDGPAYVQIDEGWQTAVGDWRSVKPAFPNGMGGLAAKIRSHGLLPGIWLAPFVVSAGSELAKRSPDWLLRGKNGKALRAGWNRAWGGWYYALDFYNPAVRDYLSGVFHVVTDTWGYELLQLDFLYAGCLVPPAGKTRGQVMYEAMEFLRQQAGNRRILAGGVPLGSAFGLADYCQVGSDERGGWSPRWPAWLHHRERGGTLYALHSAIGRRQLNGRAFQNDPGGFSLDANNKQLVQQHTALSLKALLGSLLFTADNLGGYSPEQTAELEEALHWQNIWVQTVTEPEPDLYAIRFMDGAEHFTAFSNLRDESRTFQRSKNDWLELTAFETIVLRS